MGLTYFISDVHLGELPLEKEMARVQRFIHFLHQLENTAERIFFIGDLFDFWFEYKYVIPKKHFQILRQLSRLNDNGVEMHYLPGNHDFWLGSFFDRELGIITYPSDWQGDIDGKKFYLFHGDGIAKRDVGYRMLKKFLRYPINIRLFCWLHPDVGIPFARFVSGSSRQYTNQIKLNDHSDYIEFAKLKFEQGFDYVIMGHRHKPFIYKEKESRYINLGDWLEHFSYGVFDGKELRIEYA